MQISWEVDFILICKNPFEDKTPQLNFGNSHILCKCYKLKKRALPKHLILCFTVDFILSSTVSRLSFLGD